MSAVTPYAECARRALLNKQNSEFWFAWGRQTAWPDENLPPIPTPGGSTAVDSPLVYKRPSLVSLCKPVNSNEDFTYRGQKYAYVADNAAIAEGGRFVYLRGRLDPSDGDPVGTFRQIGVFSDLIPAAGYESATRIAPAHVDDPGHLVYLSNDVAITIDINRIHAVEILLEAR
jgi:hypothetical protein